MQSPIVISRAYERINSHIELTPLVFSEEISTKLNNNIYFKLDSLQKTGAFKVRGVLNHLLYLHEIGKTPNKIVSFSTGNYALAIGYVSRLLNLQARIYLPKYVSNTKKLLARSYGTDVVEVDTRQEAELRSYEDRNNGYYYIHPSDNDDIIAGYGTMAYEAIKQFNGLFSRQGDQNQSKSAQDRLSGSDALDDSHILEIIHNKEFLEKSEINNAEYTDMFESQNMSAESSENQYINPDYIFASCGGGGLLSGSYLAKELLAPSCKVIGAEPKNASDAYQSVKSGTIFRFDQSPETIADGLKALSVSKRSFEYLKNLDEIVLVKEEDIFSATCDILKKLNVNSEPSASISLGAAENYIKSTAITNKNIIILISGGNFNVNEFLSCPPSSS